MTKYFCLIACVLCGCTSEVSRNSEARSSAFLQIRDTLDLTPAEDSISRPPLEKINLDLRQALQRWGERKESSSRCLSKLMVQVQPRVVYGTHTVEGATQHLAHWSALIGLSEREANVSAQLEIVFERGKNKVGASTLSQELSQTASEFAEFVKNALMVLNKMPSELKHVLKTGSGVEKKVLLERISLCGESEFNAQLDNALAFATDSDVRFRLIGLIGERRRHGAAHQLIDLIDLNDIEWTRSIIRTLSTLEHPRTLELISILAVHDSPALQKELKSALERLERK